jgi:hypothetical protein
LAQIHDLAIGARRLKLCRNNPFSRAVCRNLTNVASISVSIDLFSFNIGRIIRLALRVVNDRTF